MRLILNIIKRLISSSLFRASGIYTITGVLNAAIPLLLLPLLTNKLSPADYGIVAMFQLIVSIIYPIMAMNLEGSISRKFYEKDDSDFPSYVGTCIFLMFLNVLVTGTIYFILFGYISHVTLVPKMYLKYTILVAICQFLTTVLLTTYQIRIKPIGYGIYQIAQTLVNISLTLLFVVGYGLTWKGRLDAQIYTGVLASCIGVILLIKSKQIRINIKMSDVKHALNFGIPLIPHALGGLLFTAVDRFFLTKLAGLDQTGNYSVAYQLGAIISLITLAFNNAYTPWLFGELNKNNEQIKVKIVKFTYYYFIFISGLALFTLTIFPYIIKIFVGHRFSSINSYSTFIIWGFVFQGMYYMVTNYIGYVNKTYLLAIITISVGIIKIPITYYSIKILGGMGASVSYCLTFFLFFLATWVLSARVYKMPWFSFHRIKNNVI